MKNKRGQSSVGLIILMAVMIIVCVAFLPIIFDTQAGMTDSVTMTNTTFTAAGTGNPNVSVDVTGQEIISDLVITNATGNLATNTMTNGINVSITEGVSPRTGTKRILMTTVLGDHSGQGVNISMVYGLEGYIDDAGGRGVAKLIGLFACFAILTGALYYWYQNGGLDILNNR